MAIEYSPQAGNAGTDTPPDTKHGFAARLTDSPRARNVARRTIAIGIATPRRVFPQWVRALLAVIIWLGLTPIYVGLVSPYSTYMSARDMCVGLAVTSGAASLLWPTHTPAWRTVAWAALLSTITGMLLLSVNAGRFALMAATIVGFGVVALRANKNARKLWNLIQTWRLTRGA